MPDLFARRRKVAKRITRQTAKRLWTLAGELESWQHDHPEADAYMSEANAIKSRLMELHDKIANKAEEA